MSLTRQIASRIAALDPATFDPEALRWARCAIADLIGCVLLGAPTGTADLVFMDQIFGAGPCLVLGRRQRLGALDAGPKRRCRSTCLPKSSPTARGAA